MRYIFLLIVFFVATGMLMSQSNLVLNPSFEQKDTCPYGVSGISEHNCRDWNAPSVGTSDYFHICGYCDDGSIEPRNALTVPTCFAGYQIPHLGVAYSGIIVYLDLGIAQSYREYIQGKLRDSLHSGQRYIIQYYISSGEQVNNYCIDNIGMYFSDSVLDYSTSAYRIPVIPQFQNPEGNFLDNFTGWQKIEGSFVASGGEKYFSIGAFDTEANIHKQDCLGIGIQPGATIYTYIDDVSVIDTSIIDTINLCQFDSVFLGGAWRNKKQVGSLFVDTAQGMFVKTYLAPANHPSYHTNVDVFFNGRDSIKAGYLWMFTDSTLVLHFSTPYNCDSVVYYHCISSDSIDGLCNGGANFELFPNPVKDILKVKMKGNATINYSFQILDVLGRVVLSPSIQNCELDISILRNGLYFLKIVNAKTGKVIMVKKFVKE